ncbi:MAG: hypothetical protein JWP00_3772 [Chloroflexi bacterium]|jgi:hypothetical protein|nr:hypothetical protein [Chloroflexota bacterium]
MNTRPISIVLQEQREQSGGGWEVIAVYNEEEQETLATFSPFLNRELVKEIVELISKSQGLSNYQYSQE